MWSSFLFVILIYVFTIIIHSGNLIRQAGTWNFNSTSHRLIDSLAKIRYQRSGDKLHTMQIESSKFLKALTAYNISVDSLKPYLSFNLTLVDQNGDEIQHETKVIGERRSDLDSDLFSFESQSKTNKIMTHAEANISIENDYESFAKIKIGDHLSSQIEFIPYRSVKVLMSCFNLSTHLTDLMYPSKNETDKEINTWIQINIKSQKKNLNVEKENCLYLHGSYLHDDSINPSGLAIKIGQVFFSNLEVFFSNPDVKTINFSTMLLPNLNEFKHNTEVKFEPRASRFSLNSNTEKNGILFNNLKTFFTINPDEKSHLSFYSKLQNTWKGQAEIDPRNRRALLKFDISQYKHLTEFSKDGSYRLMTMTTKGPENILNLNCSLNLQFQLSYLKFKAGNNDNYNGQILIHPQNKFGEICLKTKNLKHDLLLKIESVKMSPTIVLKSSTIYQNASLAIIEAQISGLEDENKFKLEFPQFNFNSNLNFPSKSATFKLNYRKTRQHMIGSAFVDNEFETYRSFHFDFANQNPFHISLHLVHLDPEKVAESWQVFYKQNMIGSSHYQCNLGFIKGKQLSYELELMGKLTENEFKFGAKTLAPSERKMEGTFTLALGTEKPDEQYYLDANLVYQNACRYQFVVDLTKHLETRKLDGKMQLRTPQLEQYFTTFTIDITNRQFKLDMTNEKNEKQVYLETKFTNNMIHMNALSNIFLFPSIDAELLFIPGEEIYAKLYLDEARKLELVAKYTGELSMLQFSALTRVDSVYTPLFEINAEGSKSSEDGNSQRMVSLAAKYNKIEVFEMKFKQQNVEKWNAEGQMWTIDDGAKLLETSIRTIPVESMQHAYELKWIQRSITPFIVLIQEQQPFFSNNFVRTIKLNISSFSTTKKIASTVILLKHLECTKMPQLIEILLKYFPLASSVSLHLSIQEDVSQWNQFINQPSLFADAQQRLAIESSEEISSKIRNQFLITNNQNSAGFVLVTTHYGTESNSIKYDLKIYLPYANGRIVQVVFVRKIIDGILFLNQQLCTDLSRQQNSLYQQTALAKIDSYGRFEGQIKLESYKLSNLPKVLKFIASNSTQEKPFDIELLFDFGADEQNALTIKTMLKRIKFKDESNHYGHFSTNHTWHFFAKSQTLAFVNFSLDAYVTKSSVGLFWHSINRQGQSQQGHYLLQFIDSDRFEIILRNSTQLYIGKGTCILKYSNSSLMMDFVVSKLINNHLRFESIESVLIQQHKIHIETNEKCLKADIRDTQSTNESIHHASICFGLNPSNLAQFRIVSSCYSEKTVQIDAQIEVKTDAQVFRISLRWNPEFARYIVSVLLQQSNQSKLFTEFVIKEFFQELFHKYFKIPPQLVFDIIFKPIVKIVYQELFPFYRELGIDKDEIIQWFKIIYQPIKFIVNTFKRLIFENVENWWPNLRMDPLLEQWQHGIRENCQKSETCLRISQLVYSFYNSENFSQLYLDISQTLPMIEINTNLLPQSIKRFIFQSTKFVYVALRDACTKREKTHIKMWQRLVLIIDELVNASDWENFRWDNVPHVIKQAIKLLAPSAWQSCMRVLLWDPKNGQLQFELQNPKIRVREILKHLHFIATTAVNHENTIVTPSPNSTLSNLITDIY